MENAKIVRHLGKDVQYIDGIPCFVNQVHENWASVEVINTVDFTFEKAIIAKVNGFFAHAKTMKEAFAEAMFKYMKSLDTRDVIEEFKKEYPTLESTATAEELSLWHRNLTGSCEFGRNQFAEEHNIDMEDVLTIEMFLNWTKDSFGSEVINELQDSYVRTN